MLVRERRMPRKMRNEQYFDEAIRMYYDERLSCQAIADRLPVDINRETIRRWIVKFAGENYEPMVRKKRDASINTSADRQVDLQEEVCRLKMLLKAEKMRADAYDTMIDIAEQTFNIPIRKKLDAKQ